MCEWLSKFTALSSEFLFLPPYLELILLVFGSLVKGPVISEPPDVIELVEAFDVVRHSISLQHILTLRDGGNSVDLQVWKHAKLSKVQERGARVSSAEFISDLKEHGNSYIHSHTDDKDTLIGRGV